MVEHEGRKHKKRHSTRRIGSGRARNRMSKITASATTTATSNGMSGGGNKKKRELALEFRDTKAISMLRPRAQGRDSMAA